MKHWASHDGVMIHETPEAAARLPRAIVAHRKILADGETIFVPTHRVCISCGHSGSTAE